MEAAIGGGISLSFVGDLTGAERLGDRDVCLGTCGDFGGGIDSESLISPSSRASSSSTSIGAGAMGDGALTGSAGAGTGLAAGAVVDDPG